MTCTAPDLYYSEVAYVRSRMIGCRCYTYVCLQRIIMFHGTPCLSQHSLIKNIKHSPHQLSFITHSMRGKPQQKKQNAKVVEQ